MANNDKTTKMMGCNLTPTKICAYRTNPFDEDLLWDLLWEYIQLYNIILLYITNIHRECTAGLSLARPGIHEQIPLL